MMWIKKLDLVNFRGIASLSLDLDRPLTVLVGPTGSGKSSVLRALAALTAQKHGDPEVHLEERDLRVMQDGARVCALLKHSQGHEFEAQISNVNRVWDPVPVCHPGSFPGESDPSPDLQRIFLTQSLVHTVLRLPWFVAWFKERENLENAEIVQTRNFEYQDPQLRVIREALSELHVGVRDPRIQRDPSGDTIVVRKAYTWLRLDQLSEGEREPWVLIADLALQFVQASPSSMLARNLEAVVLIDAVEQGLHPRMQREILPSLQRAFPRAQFIVTTHSPQVLSSIPNKAVVRLGTGAHEVTTATLGRDSNALLREVLLTPERPARELEEIHTIRALIDQRELGQSRKLLDELAEKLSEQDEEVTRLRMRWHAEELALRE